MAVKGRRLQAVDPEDDENVAVDPEAMDQLAKKPVVLRPVRCRCSISLPRRNRRNHRIR